MYTLVVIMSSASASLTVGAIIVRSTFIAKDLHMNDAGIAWIPASSSLTSGAFLLGTGQARDLFGRKTILLASLSMLTIFCVATGFSQTGIGLDALNGVLGLASASAIPAALGILGAAYDKPSKRKNYAFACFSAGNPLGFVFGCILGGVATQLASWRATFWSLAVVFPLTTISAGVATPADKSEKIPWRLSTLKRFDFMGTLLTVSGVALLSAALTEGTEGPQGWTTPYIIVLLVLGVALLAAFVFWEWWYSFPLMPLTIWRGRNFTLLCVILLLGFLAFPIALFWLALFLQRVWHLLPLSVAVHLLPAAVSGILVRCRRADLAQSVQQALDGLRCACLHRCFLAVGAQQEYQLLLGLLVSWSGFNGRRSVSQDLPFAKKTCASSCLGQQRLIYTTSQRLPVQCLQHVHHAI